VSYPVKELITQNIEETLKGISTANGYSYTLKVSRYVGTQHYSPEHLNAMIYQDGETRIEQDVHTKDARELRIAVDVFIQPLDTDTTPVDTICNIIEAEMTKVLYSTYDRGGLAIDTAVEPADPFTEFGEADGFTLVIKVKYRTAYGDMYLAQS
jgi:hypothetical protein